MRAASHAPALVLGALLAAGCDEVQTLHYRGEETLVVRAALRYTNEPVQPEEAAGTLHAALLWGRADGGPELARVDPAWVEPFGYEAADVHVYSRPPEAALRPGTTGRWALGELVLFADRDGDQRWDADEPIHGRLTLVAASPEGATDPAFLGALPPGLWPVDSMGPCAASDLRLVLAPEREVRVARLARRRLADYAAGDPHAFDPACGVRLARLGSECPRFETIRGVCRSDLLTADERPLADALCAQCEWLVFPPRADAAACREWRARWDSHVLRPALNRQHEEVFAEQRLCLDGEPEPARDCDHTCACDARRRYCRDVERRSAAACTADYEDCLTF